MNFPDTTIGATIGGKIGGAVGYASGSWLGGEVGGWASDQLKKTDAHEKVVDWTADRIDDAYNLGADAVNAVGKGIQKSAKEVDKVLNSAVDGFVSLFSL